MGTDKDLFRFYTRNEDLKNWLQSELNQSEFIETILNKFRTGELIEPTDLDYQNRMKAAKLKKEEAIANIKDWEWKHIETFEKTPSSQAKSAIKDKAYRELNQNEIELISKHISLEHTFDGWRITCKHCRNQVTYNDRLEALHQAARHLSAVHGHKILETLK